MSVGCKSDGFRSGLGMLSAALSGDVCTCELCKFLSDGDDRDDDTGDESSPFCGCVTDTSSWCAFATLISWIGLSEGTGCLRRGVGVGVCDCDPPPLRRLGLIFMTGVEHTAPWRIVAAELL
ncbi:hypothetical protein OGATHE_004348 [Ogataea polymorpha]|uniref:Uncharacterized protein n=1 Tax=Ogataea polymorpha TaxID=460523 RepID=A0A9P8P0V5_9ASCO|nr:hypothetical protein OGATHE_004348 [Ogataea polymorpha]